MVLQQEKAPSDTSYSSCPHFFYFGVYTLTSMRIRSGIVRLAFGLYAGGDYARPECERGFLLDSGDVQTECPLSRRDDDCFQGS